MAAESGAEQHPPIATRLWKVPLKTFHNLGLNAYCASMPASTRCSDPVM